VLCSLIPIIPLICLLVPELCALAVCIIDPLLCLPPLPPLPPTPPTPPKPTGPLFVLFTNVRASNTPAGANDRIPDKDSTSVLVSVFGFKPGMSPIRISALDTSRTNGDVDINGAREIFVTASTLIQVHGISQTSPAASLLPLSLLATMGPVIIGQSFPFAVAAFMENMATTLDSVVDTPARVGMFASMTWVSDGARGVRSLNEFEFQEQLALLRETGTFVGTGTGSPGLPQVGDLMPADDQHSTARTVIRGTGEQEVQQVHALLDNRSQSIAAVTKSGFKIVRVVEPDPARSGCLRFVVTKTGNAGSVGGFSSGAGSGKAEAIIPLPCGGGPGPSPGAGPTHVFPTPFSGPIPPSTIPFGYVTGLRPHPATGSIAIITIVYRSRGRLCDTQVPVRIDPETPTEVHCHSINPVPIDLAPLGDPPIVMSPGTPMHIPHRLIR
jgi:hypothetical protein